MVCAGLAIHFRVNGVALAELDLAILLKVVELPADERVVIGVDCRGDERTSPVDIHSEQLQIVNTLWREELQPVVGVTELRHVLSGDADLLQDLELSLWVLELWVFL